jgi:hypothetical protein
VPFKTRLQRTQPANQVRMDRPMSPVKDLRSVAVRNESWTFRHGATERCFCYLRHATASGPPGAVITELASLILEPLSAVSEQSSQHFVWFLSECAEVLCSRWAQSGLVLIDAVLSRLRVTWGENWFWNAYCFCWLVHDAKQLLRLIASD